jgi:hypothetical protein
MKSFGINFVAALVIASVSLSGVAIACNGGGGGGYVRTVRTGNNGNSNYNNYQSCNANGGYSSNPNFGNYGQAYEPNHSTYFVQPGDTFYEISLKEYGTSAPTSYISRYNRMAPNAALVPGQQLWLPSISANGQLSASRAPRAENPNVAPNATPTSTAKLTQLPISTPVSRAIAESEPERASVPTGSVIKLDGQSLGDKQGVVRLKISNVALPVEVVEWTADSTKVRLPKLDVTGSMNAELEVVRADGTIAATNAIELTTAASSLAAAN